jgi:hypothetical protein
MNGTVQCTVIRDRSSDPRTRPTSPTVSLVVLGLLVDSEIVLSTRYGKTRVFINKTLSTETAYQQDLINRDLLSTRLIVGKVGPVLRYQCGVASLTVLLMYWCVRHKGK